MQRIYMGNDAEVGDIVHMQGQLTFCGPAAQTNGRYGLSDKLRVDTTVLEGRITNIWQRGYTTVADVEFTIVPGVTVVRDAVEVSGMYLVRKADGRTPQQVLTERQRAA